MRRAFLIAMMIVAAPLAAMAQPLSDRVPADALIYVGWRGSESMGPGYEQSHLKAVLDASGIAQTIDNVLPQLMDRLGKEEPDAGPVVGLMATIGKVMWKHPSAIYIGPIDFSGREPMPRLAVLTQAGADGKALVDQINQMLQQAGGEIPIPVSAQLLGDMAVLTVGDVGDATRALFGGPQAIAPAKALKTNATFQATLKQLNSDPVAMLYIDTDAIVRLITDGIEKESARRKERGFEQRPHDPDVMWPKIRDALGLNGLKRVAWTAGFDGKDWADHVFVEAPAPRVGLLTLIDHKPLSNDLIKRIPATAPMVTTGRLDLARVLTEARAIVGKIEPEATEEIDGMLAMLRQQIGLDLEADILRPLGDEWAMYSDRSIAGKGLMGFVLVNKLREPARAEITFTTIANKINQLAAEFVPDADVRVQIKTTKVGDLTIHYLAVPAVAPAWTIHDGYLYVALYPQTLVATIDRVKAGGKSLLDNPRFAAMRKRLGGDNTWSFQWVDLPQTAGDGYQMTLLLSQLLTGAAEMLGVDAPPMLVPPLNKIDPHLSEAGTFTWTDEAGLHIRAVSPFPGATLLAMDNNLMLSQNLMMLGVMMPALSQARTTARSVSSMNNLRQITLGCHTYAADNDGKMPADLAALFKDGYLDDPAILMHPEGARRGEPIEAPDPDGVTSAWVKRNSDYIFVAGGKKVTDGDTTSTVLAFERTDYARQGMINVSFMDGHVERMPVELASERIQKQTGKSLRQLEARGTPPAP